MTDCDGKRISRKRSTAERRARGGEHFHDLPAPAEGGQRKTAAHTLSERREIGRIAERLLRAAETQPEARNHLIEDHQRAVTPRALENTVEEAGFGKDQPHVADDRFESDRSQQRLATCKFSIDVGEIVVARDDGLGPYAR